VAIFEFAYHNEVVEAYIFHFLPIVSQIYVFTHDFILEQIADKFVDKPVIWIIKDSDENYKSFIQKHRKTIKNCQLTVFTSLPEPLTNIDFTVFECPVWLLIHNIHYFFAKPFTHLHRGKNPVFDVLKILRFYLTGKEIIKNNWLSNVDEIIFPTQNIKKYYQQHFLSGRFPEPLVIPFIKAEDKPQFKKTQSPFHIVIPGNITTLSRNYDIVYQAVKNVLEKTNQKIKLTLAGKQKDPSCDRVLNKFALLDKSKLDFTYSKEFINQATFENILTNADVLVAPLNQQTSYGIHNEKYGFSTESGNIADAVRYGLPLVIPDFYPVSEALEHMTFRFSTASKLTDRLLYFMEHPVFLPDHNVLKMYQSSEVSKYIESVWNKNP
jgi:hypothetical protein